MFCEGVFIEGGPTGEVLVALLAREAFLVLLLMNLVLMVMCKRLTTQATLVSGNVRVTLELVGSVIKTNITLLNPVVNDTFYN